MDVFTCQHCGALPEPIAGSAMFIVRHRASWQVLIAQAKGRWPHEPVTLPDTPAQVLFAQRAAFGRLLGQAGPGSQARRYRRVIEGNDSTGTEARRAAYRAAADYVEGAKND